MKESLERSDLLAETVEDIMRRKENNGKKKSRAKAAKRPTAAEPVEQEAEETSLDVRYRLLRSYQERDLKVAREKRTLLLLKNPPQPAVDVSPKPMAKADLERLLRTTEAFDARTKKNPEADHCEFLHIDAVGGSRGVPQWRVGVNERTECMLG
jgi:hypothetical protein